MPKFGGDYVEGVAGAPARINPLFAAENSTDQALVDLVFAGLTRLDEHGVAFPDLAESWTVSSDGKVYSFNLRPGLLWQDGQPLTADDVLFTYQLLLAPTLRSPPQLAKLLAGSTITKQSSLSFRIELTQAYAPLPAFLALGILPVHMLQNIGPSQMYDAGFNQHPVGAGAYQLQELTPDHAVLIANPAYHFGQPFVQHVELRFYRDEGAVLAALRRNEVNGALFSGGVAPADLFYIEHRSDLQTHRLPTTETVYVYFNLRLEQFQDRRVRQALLYAIDRDSIVNDNFGGQVLRADSPIGPGNWAHSDALARYQYDPNVAGLLLEEAGWKLNTANVRRKDGKDFTFTLTTNSDPVRVAIAQKIAEEWTSLGLTVTVATTGSTTLVRDMLEPRTYEVALFAHVAQADPDPYLEWHTSQQGPKGANLSLLSDPRFDKTLEDARLTATMSQRQQLYAQFQELFAQEVPAIPLYTSTALYVQPASMKGVRLNLLTDPGDRFWQVQEWYLKTR